MGGSRRTLEQSHHLDNIALSVKVIIHCAGGVVNSYFAIKEVRVIFSMGPCAAFFSPSFRSIGDFVSALTSKFDNAELPHFALVPAFQLHIT
jgi:hypothetical protein